MRELGQTFVISPTDRILIESLSATNSITVADFVNSYSTVFYTFSLSSNGDLLMTLFTANTGVSSTDLGRVRPVWQGPYSPIRTYVPNDIVYSNGSAFIALLSSLAVTPVSASAQWDLLAQGFVPGTTLDIVDNIAALRTASTSDGSIVYAAGYYTTNDRGGGKFRFIAAATDVDDGGRFIKPTAIDASSPGRWYRLLDGEEANVKMWGAKGDGVTDDSTTIQKAISAMQYGWSLKLLVPTGTYIVTQTLQLPARIHLHGEGNQDNTTILMQQGTVKDLIVTSNTVSALSTANYDTGIVVEDLALGFAGYTSSGTTNTGNVALTICQPSVSHVIRNVTTLGGGYGIRCIGAGSPGLRIQNVAANFAWVAGVKVDLLSAGDYNQINIDGLSMVNRFGIANTKGVWFNQIQTNAAIRNLDAEGSFNGGVIHWDVPQLAAGETAAQLRVDSATFKGDGVLSTPFIAVATTAATPLSAGGQQIPLISVGNVTLSNCTAIISDQISNYNVVMQGTSGLQTGEGRTPFQYEVSSANDIASNRRLKMLRPDTAVTTFSATSAGWYRIASGSAKSLNGNFNISSTFESTNFDVVMNERSLNAIFTVNRHSKISSFTTQPFVTKARAVYYTNDSCYLDVYINTVPGLSSSQPFDKFITFSQKADSKHTLLSVPSPVETVLTSVSGFDEVTFDGGLIQTRGNYNTPHIKIGENHLWFAGDKSLRHFNSGVDLLFVNAAGDTTGTGASAKAFFNNGVISYVIVTSKGSNYTKDPLVYVVVNETGNGSGASLSARTTGSQVTTVDVLAGGTGYGSGPASEYAGRKFLTDSDIGANASTGTSFRVARRLSVNDTFSITTAAANSRTITGTGFLNNLFVGDRLLAPNTLVYEVATVVSDTIATFLTPYPTQVTGSTFYRVGYEAVPALSGYKLLVTNVIGWCVDHPTWSGSPWARISVRLKNSPNITIATCPKSGLQSDSDNDLQNNFILCAPNVDYSIDDNFGPFAGGNRNVGVGCYLSAGQGISIDFCDNSGNYSRPSAGTGNVFIEVLGYKYPSGTNY